MVGSPAVDPKLCNSFIAVTVEYQATTEADANGDGIIDGCESPADLDGDGTVGILDLLALLANWGPCR